MGKSTLFNTEEWKNGQSEISYKSYSAGSINISGDNKLIYTTHSITDSYANVKYTAGWHGVTEAQGQNAQSYHYSGYSSENNTIYYFPKMPEPEWDYLRIITRNKNTGEIERKDFNTSQYESIDLHYRNWADYVNGEWRTDIKIITAFNTNLTKYTINNEFQWERKYTGQINSILLWEEEIIYSNKDILVTGNAGEYYINKTPYTIRGENTQGDTRKNYDYWISEYIDDMEKTGNQKNEFYLLNSQGHDYEHNLEKTLIEQYGNLYPNYYITKMGETYLVLGKPTLTIVDNGGYENGESRPYYVLRLQRSDIVIKIEGDKLTAYMAYEFNPEGKLRIAIDRGYLHTQMKEPVIFSGAMLSGASFADSSWGSKPEAVRWSEYEQLWYEALPPTIIPEPPDPPIEPPEPTEPPVPSFPPPGELDDMSGFLDNMDKLKDDAIDGIDEHLLINQLTSRGGA